MRAIKKKEKVKNKIFELSMKQEENEVQINQMMDAI